MALPGAVATVHASRALVPLFWAENYIRSPTTLHNCRSCLTLFDLPRHLLHHFHSFSCGSPFFVHIVPFHPCWVQSILVILIGPFGSFQLNSSLIKLPFVFLYSRTEPSADLRLSLQSYIILESTSGTIERSSHKPAATLQ